MSYFRRHGTRFFTILIFRFNTILADSVWNPDESFANKWTLNTIYRFDHIVRDTESNSQFEFANVTRQINSKSISIRECLFISKQWIPETYFSIEIDLSIFIIITALFLHGVRPLHRSIRSACLRLRTEMCAHPYKRNKLTAPRR